jgi:predicted ATP-dependent serine protease
VPPEPGDPKESTRSETTMADGGDAPISDAVVGRDDELAIISQALDSAADSRGQVVVLAGEAGIGKTFLLSHTLKSAEKRGFRVINATCRVCPALLRFGRGKLHWGKTQRSRMCLIRSSGCNLK